MAGHGLCWRKSSQSSMQGNCVEVAFAEASVLARDSKLPAGESLKFSELAWAKFVSGIRAGRFVANGSQGK